MEKLFNIINIPLAFILKGLSNLVGDNFALAVFIFTLLMNIVMIPLTIKSQKASVQQIRIKPKMDAIKKKYADDKLKQSEAMQALYQQENVSMAGGCGPMLIRLPIMMSIYYLIRSPLTYLFGISHDKVQAAWDMVVEKGLVTNTKVVDEIAIINSINSGAISCDIPTEAISGINFNFFGIALTETPKFSLDFSNAQLIWIIPLLSFAAAIASSLISMKVQKINNPDAPSMKGMMLTMPVISLIIAFGVPGAVGFYWACSSLISGILQAALQYFYGPNQIIAKECSNETYKLYTEENRRAAKKDGADEN
ncbi:MAG: membrane protein insertase YidC [Clostridia bacterium]|nr:membrane protein insertase YidC [Clostridia bacterium]